MKKLLICVACGVMLASCLNQSYSVSSDAVDEMLAAPGMAVTPFQPAWLNEDGKGIYPLSKEARAKVCAILLAGKNRHVPELAYQLDDENDPLAQNRFYLYASNSQCLAGTVMDTRVVMHDVVLTEAQEQELFALLKPYLKKVFTGLK